MSVRIAPVDTWPDLRITVHLFPWTWRVRPWLYHDDVEGWRGFTLFRWLFLQVEWWANTPLITEASAASGSALTDDLADPAPVTNGPGSASAPTPASAPHTGDADG